MRTTSVSSEIGSAKPAGGERQAGRPASGRGADEVIEHYLSEAEPAVALDFVDALEDALRHDWRTAGERLSPPCA